MSIVYWGVLLAVVLCGSAAEGNPKAKLRRDGSFFIRPDPGMAFILSAILILISGLRYRVGTDYMAYYSWQVPTWENVWKNFLSFNESGFSLLTLLSRSIWDDRQSLILFSAVITVGLYTWTIYREGQAYLLSMLLYLFLGQWQGSFNAIRQYLAGAVLFAGYHYMLKKDYGKYILIVVLASLFHKMALVMIVPCFLFLRKPDITQLVILAAGSIVLVFSTDTVFRIIDTMKGKTTIFADEIAYRSNSVSLFRILVGFVPVLIYIFFCRKDRHTEKQDFFINAAFFNAFALLAGWKSAYLGRIGMYTNGFLVLGYHQILQLIRDDKARIITYYFVVVLYFLFWLYSIQAGGISAFQWVFSR